jgi:DNA-directed RNA polymerase specialized sigma24 family protein
LGEDDSVTTIAELEALYRRRYFAFARVAAAIAGDPARGADAVHDAFANAIAALGSYRREGPLEAWVWRIVIRAATAARSQERVAGAPPSSNGSGAPLDEGAPIRALVAALPERQRLAVFLRYFADLDYRAIAAALDVEVGTVSATLNAAHRALRRSLEEATL